jgi:hypothetical protein
METDCTSLVTGVAFGRRGGRRKRHWPEIDPADREAGAVLALVAERRSISTALLLHPSRGMAPVADARQLAMYLVHVLLGRNLTDVGTLFGRDRTTVAHACRSVEDRRDDGPLEREIEELEQRFAAWREADDEERANGTHG